MKKFNNNLVVQSNTLIEARFTNYMSEQEQKALAFVISETKPSDIDLYMNNQNKCIEISVKEFSYIMKTSANRIYEDACILSNTLTGKKFRIEYIGANGKSSFQEIALISMMQYDSGVLKIQINSSALIYLIELKEKFTVFRLENVLRLGSSYAIKIYQLLKQYESIHTRVFTIDELKDILAVTSDSYNLYSNFKRKVLEVSKTHINLHTDIQIDYEEIKLSRKVHKIKFYIKSKLNQEQQAKIAFEAYINTLSNTHQLRHLWDQFKPENRWKRFAKELDDWIERKIFNYEPNSCDLLQYIDKNDLFFSND